MAGEARDDVCVVMPVYNEASVVGDVVREVRQRFPLVVCIDDGSTDESVAKAAGAGAVIVRHPINLGQGAALQTGIEYGLAETSARYFVTFDSDGQHDVDDVAAMLEVLDAGRAQIVFGSRFLDSRTQLGVLKYVILQLGVRYTRWSTKLNVSDTHNGLRCFDRDVAEAMELTMNGMAHASEITNLVASRRFLYDEVPVHIRYTDYSRGKGQSLMNSVNILFDIFLR